MSYKAFNLNHVRLSSDLPIHGRRNGGTHDVCERCHADLVFKLELVVYSEF